MTQLGQDKNGSDPRGFVCMILAILFLLSPLAGFTTAEGNGPLEHIQANGINGTRGESSSVFMVNANITGQVLGGFVELLDEREIYNAGSSMAVTYVFALGAGMNITELVVSRDGEVPTYNESSGGVEYNEVLHNPGIVFLHTIEASTSSSWIAGAVEITDEPGLFALSGHRLLVCQFSMDTSTIAKVSVRYSFPLGSGGGLFEVGIPLAPAVVITDGTADISPGNGASLRIELNAIGVLEGLYSPSHGIEVTKGGLHTAVVTWNGEVAPGDVMTVFYQELRDAFGAGFLNHRLDGMTMYRTDEDGYFMFLFNPNTEEFSEHVMAKDVVFIIDTSGSMQNAKIEQAKKALVDVLGMLGEEDRFTMVRFSSSVSTWQGELINATPTNLLSAQSWVNDLRAEGGTNINEALLTGIEILGNHMADGRPREIIFLTDGEATTGVTDTGNILQNVQGENTGREVEATLHVFGIGYDINTYLLDSLSVETDGTTTYIGPDENIDEVLAPFYDSISDPVLMDITMEISGIETIQRYPETMPHLYRGSELTIVGMYYLPETGPDPTPGPITIFVNGTTTEGNTSYQFTYDMASPGQHDFLPWIYGTRAVGDLLDDIKRNGETQEKIDQVKWFGKRYGIETPYSSLTVHTNSQFDSEGFRTLTGEASVKASGLIRSYSQTRIASKGLLENGKIVGERTFLDIQGMYIQSDLLPEDEVIELGDTTFEEWVTSNIPMDSVVRFGSPGYFELAEDNEVLDILSLGPEIVYQENGRTIGITRGNLFLFIRNLQTTTWDENLSITWETNVPATSMVRYRKEEVGTASGPWSVALDETLVVDHNVTISLTHDCYEFSVESSDVDGNVAVKDNNQQYYIAVHTPLSILSVQSSIGIAVITGGEVTIRWYTNVPADGELRVFDENGETYLTGATSNTKVHEITFTTSGLQSDGSVETYYFYVAARTGNFFVTEDNHGQNFEFDVVGSATSSPSFDASPILLFLAAGLVVFISMMTRNGQSAGHEQEEDSGKGMDDHPEDGGEDGSESESESGSDYGLGDDSDVRIEGGSESGSDHGSEEDSEERMEDGYERRDTTDLLLLLGSRTTRSRSTVLLLSDEDIMIGRHGTSNKADPDGSRG